MMTNDDDEYILIFKEKIYSWFDEFIAKKNVKIKVLPRCNKLLFNQVKLPLAISKEKADVYFFPAFPAPFFFFNKNAVSAIHDVGCWDCPSENKRYMTMYFKIMYWKACCGNKKIITVSEFSKQRISDILKKKKDEIEVVFNGVSKCFENFTYSENNSEKAVELYHLPNEYILCLSTVEPRKNMRLLIEAYDELISENKIDVDLVLAGRKGWLVDNLLNDVNEKTIKRIHFTGFVEEELLPYVYSNARIFVFPSLYEGFGVPPIEAMAMGVPVISSDAASLPEVLGKSSIMFENKNKDQLKKCIIDVMNFDKQKIGDLKRKGYSCAKQYDWKTEAEKLHGFFIDKFVGEKDE